MALEVVVVMRGQYIETSYYSQLIFSKFCCVGGGGEIMWVRSGGNVIVHYGGT